MSAGGRPLYVQTTLTTGMPILGKISVGVLIAESVPKIRMTTARTMNVYGRSSATRTILSIGCVSSRGGPRSENRIQEIPILVIPAKERVKKYKNLNFGVIASGAKQSSPLRGPLLDC